MTARAAIKCLAASLLAWALPAVAQGTLENPPAGARASGISLVSGWHCTASRIEVSIDSGAPVAVASGTPRGDTAAACGRTDTGFGLLLNWGLLPPGRHTLRVLADGAEFARREFDVVSLGGEFLTGRSATTEIADFPTLGRTSVIEWRESSQSFAIIEIRETSPALSTLWAGAVIERRTACTFPQNEGTRGTYVQLDIFQSGNEISIRQDAVTGLSCTYRGAFSQAGPRRQASGNFTCTDGKQGEFTTTAFLVAARALSIEMAIRLTGGESCSIEAVIGGSRL